MLELLKSTIFNLYNKINKRNELIAEGALLERNAHSPQNLSGQLIASLKSLTAPQALPEGHAQAHLVSCTAPRLLYDLNYLVEFKSQNETTTYQINSTSSLMAPSARP